LTLTLDLGLGGMKIKTHHQYLPENECMDFTLVLGHKSIWPKGRIAYSRLLPDNQCVSGIEFMALSPDDYALLQRCLATL
jgi:hypothetical protein